MLAEATESSRCGGIDLFGGIERYNTGLIIEYRVCAKRQNNGCQNNAYATKEADVGNGRTQPEKEFSGYGSRTGAEVPKLNSPHENKCCNLNNFNAIGNTIHYPYKKC